MVEESSPTKIGKQNSDDYEPGSGTKLVTHALGFKPAFGSK
jgi:hypothetical protein